MTRVCSKCGNKLLHGQHICDCCGTRAPDEQETVSFNRKPTITGTAPVQPVILSPQSTDLKAFKKRASKKAIIGIISCGILVVLICTVLLFQFYGLGDLIHEVITNG
mgnify:CR=1 FL=1